MWSLSFNQRIILNIFVPINMIDDPIQISIMFHHLISKEGNSAHVNINILFAIDSACFGNFITNCWCTSLFVIADWS